MLFIQFFLFFFFSGKTNASSHFDRVLPTVSIKQQIRVKKSITVQLYIEIVLPTYYFCIYLIYFDIPL